MNRMRTPAKPAMSNRMGLRTPAKPSRQNSANSLTNKDPVQVFCRIRPMPSESDMSCMKVISPTTVLLTPPQMAVNYKLGTLKETQCTFRHVFDQPAKQREVYSCVAQPLVENLIRGKNGLLFTYGVTGSGKTYTMNGDLHCRGIMPRCLDSLFRTIADFQTKKFVFKSDRMNSFEILSDADAMLERQTELNGKLMKGRRNHSDPEIASQVSTDIEPLSGIDEDNMYGVFVTYVEVYNNSVYDLLKETGDQKEMVPRVPQSLIIREDARHNMYVHNVTELEVKSVEEALEAFQVGQKRKRMGHTVLNADSSRSHCVFTIRLVQAPTDSQGEYVVQDKQTITISQLSLVDLAGSERLSRTNNTGQRLREAGSINNSLMTLRSCLETLRENQQTCGNKKVPYRESKLTNLFKSYFDGEGNVRMVVCVNPRAEDYDENSQVMKFAEMTQEIQIARPTPAKNDLGFTPGRRKANQIFKAAVIDLEDNGCSEARKLDVDLALVYSLGPSFPDYRLDSPENKRVVSELCKFLEQRIEKRKILVTDMNNRMDNFRHDLMAMQKENLALKSENSSLKAVVKMEREKTQALETKVMIHERSLDEMNRKLRELEAQKAELQHELQEKQILVRQKEQEKENQRKKFEAKIGIEKTKMQSELDQKLQKQRQKLEEKRMTDKKKIKLVSNIINATTFDAAPTDSEAESAPLKASQVVYSTPSAKSTRGVAVANSRNRRSKSADRWLEHRAKNPVELGTIFQPFFRTGRKSVTQVEESDFTNKNNSKYCLVDQVADTDGEVETKIYKGDIIPTVAGGAQVIFNDVELLKQLSPQKSPPRKRPSGSTATTPGKVQDVGSKCSVGIEGHSNKKQKMYF